MKQSSAQVKKTYFYAVDFVVPNDAEICNSNSAVVDLLTGVFIAAMTVEMISTTPSY